MHSKEIGILYLSNMEKILKILLIMLMSGCSSLDLNKVAPGYIGAYEAIKVLVVGHKDDNITQELIKNIPYASMTLNVGKGPKGLMILESKTYDLATWVSADNVYIREKNGKIIQSKGLGNNLDELLFTVDFKNLLEIDTDKTYIYYKSYSNPDLFNLELKANFKVKDRKLTKLLNREIFLTLIEEEIFSEDLGWQVTNSYWVDDNSFVWKSIQTISPKIPKIFIEVTKKPS